MLIKHATASTFVFCHVDDQWRLGLVEHPRLGRRMIVGGHVEDYETPAEAAVREATEESGLLVRLLGCPAPQLPQGYPHERVAAPWWMTEVGVPADNHLAEPHVHIDHQYVAVADSPVPVSRPAHPFAWFGVGDLDRVSMFRDTEMLARALFDRIDELVSLGEHTPVDVLATIGSVG
ncbi:NUDIX hydrolase [Pseudonocardia sp. HH130630-07]|uniref:NUDIX hydrolase n=1 Tax=Pseudonocardia sp. HH130630-07 TaxID=1690815 RepID=UPI000815062E|nr:NUDIX domain-containing protein [Pseudonocardia sp. HH130630-07]ANY07785.1 hypothetical protein AFB00_17450 [Pseudonocardia sp. HH130630-07]